MSNWTLNKQLHDSRDAYPFGMDFCKNTAGCPALFEVNIEDMTAPELG